MKNKFYLFLLIGSLAVCGTVVFRPRVADRVFGLLGLRPETVSPYVAPELEAPISPELDVPIFDAGINADYHGDINDGFAVAGPLQSMPPQFGSDLQAHPAFAGVDSREPVFDGFAVSGQSRAGNAPDFAIPDFAAASQPAVPQQPAAPIEISFANAPSTAGTSQQLQAANTSANNVPDIQFGFSAPLPTGTAPPAAPAADFSRFQQVIAHDNIYDNANAGFAVSGGGSGIVPASHADFGNAAAVSNASFIAPDLQPDIGFAGYRFASDDGAAFSGGNSLSAPSGEIQPATYNQPVNQITNGMSNVPQLSPNETPLYVPPQGNAAQGGLTSNISVPEHMSVPNLSVPPMMSPPAAPPVNPALDYGLTHQDAVASADVQRMTPGSQPPMNAVPTVNDMRSQYEPEIITEIETVFATEMLARVGSRNVIMTCDILSEVRERTHEIWVQHYRTAFDNYGEKLTAAEEQAFKAEGIHALFEQTLNNWIEVQMLYLDLSLNFPEDQLEAYKREEAKNFDKAILPKMMEQYGATNLYELDGELRKFGTTIERKRENRIIQHLGYGWFGQLANPQKSSLTTDDMRTYYERHKEEKYKNIGYAKWEELVIPFSLVSSEEEAYAKIAALGNRVQQGEAFADVARSGSQGLTSHHGGQRDAQVDELATKTLEQAVFTLPVGQMSRIIREDVGPFAGLYIVRVSERQHTHYTPFEKVQSEIQKLIYDESQKREEERIPDELRKKYLVEVVPNLQQIIAMAAEAEGRQRIVDSPDRHEQLMAWAERNDPTPKERTPRRPEQTNPQPNVQQQPQTAVAMTAHQTRPQNNLPVNRPDTRTGTPDSTWEPGLGTTVDKTGEANRKENTKNSFWNAINPFR